MNCTTKQGGKYMPCEKVKEFTKLITSKGYAIGNHPNFESEERYIVSKDNYYHVSVSGIMILEAPHDLILKDIESEFYKLQYETKA